MRLAMVVKVLGMRACAQVPPADMLQTGENGAAEYRRRDRGEAEDERRASGWRTAEHRAR